MDQTALGGGGGRRARRQQAPGDSQQARAAGVRGPTGLGALAAGLFAQMSANALSQSSGDALDYGHPIEFGDFLLPDAGDPRGVLETARLLDELGYDLIAVQDRPYQPRHLDTTSLLAAILAQTTTVRAFADVGNLPLRPPADSPRPRPARDPPPCATRWTRGEPRRPERRGRPGRVLAAGRTRGVRSVPGRWPQIPVSEDARQSWRAGAANAACSTGSSRLFARVRAGHWWCAGSRAWARRRCSTTWSSEPRAARWRAPRVSNRRWSSPTPRCTSCWRRCWIASGVSRCRSAMRCGWRSASGRGRRRIASWSALPC